MSPATCPDNETLKSLLLGKLGGSQLSQWEEHLLHCESCASKAETLDGHDALTEAIASGTFPSGDEEVLHSAIEQAKRLSSALDTVQIDETLTGDNSSSQPSSFASQKSRYKLDFLAPAERPDELGRLGDYRVLKVLGVGGMGMVFKGEDIRLGRLVALKVMRPGIAAKRDAKSRFLREARATAALSHDHVVQIHQVGEDRGVPFIAMQYLEGQSLQTAFTRLKKLRGVDVARIGKEVASGLAAAHEKGLIHRDIKPDNVWIEAKTRRAKILDFGLARDMTADAGLTQSGTILGTPRYMAPEQVTGGKVDHRADLFSLGSMLYHLAAGQPPFAGSNIAALLFSITHSTPQPLSEIAPRIDPALADLVMGLLSKEPENRPQSAAAVAKQFARIEAAMKAPTDTAALPAQPSITTKPTTSANRRPPVRRWPLVAAAGAAAFVLLLGVIVITIRNRDGKETTLEINEGIVASINVAPGSTLSIQEESSVASIDEATNMASPDAGKFETPVELSADDPPQYSTWTPTTEQQAFLDETSKLPIEDQLEAVRKKLMTINPGFDGDMSHELSNGVATRVNLNVGNVLDISPLRALSHVTYFSLTANRNSESTFSDISPLSGMPVRHFRCGNTQVSDLTPLMNLPLESFWFETNSPTADMSVLKGMPLESIYINGIDFLDLSFVKGMPLRRFNLVRAGLIDLSPLKGLPLTDVSFAVCNISDLSPLNGMELTTLKFPFNSVSDLTPLAAMPLRLLECGYNPVFDLSPLAGMPLKSININSTKVSDLSPLAGSPLEEVFLSNTNVVDISPLVDSIALRELWIWGMDGNLDKSVLENLPLNVLFYNFRLYHQADETMLLSLRLKRIGTVCSVSKTHPEYMPPITMSQFWKDVEKQRQETAAFVDHLKELPAESQIDEVRAMLARMNPGFNDNVGAKIQDGQVKSVALSVQNITNITPLRALAGLRHLVLSGSLSGSLSSKYSFHDLSPLNCLPLEELTCDDHLIRWNRDVLREIRTLKTINGKPAEYFLQRIQH